jgi:hypothetical protein
MRALQTELNDPDLAGSRGRQRRLADRQIQATAAQIPDRRDDAQHDMHRKPSRQRRPRLVRRPSPRTLGWPARTAPLSTTLLEEPELHRLCFEAPPLSLIRQPRPILHRETLFIELPSGNMNSPRFIDR